MNTATVGWTSPTIIYDRMREIDTGAHALDSAIHSNVTRKEFLEHWGTWFTRWKKFFEEYQGEFKKLGAVFYTDDLAAQVESWRKQLVEFEEAYKREGAVQPIPGIPREVPHPPPPSKQPWEIDLSVPWWVWALGGVALAGLGFYAYKMIAETKEKKKKVEDALPGFLAMRGLPAPIAAGAVANDPNPPTMVQAGSPFIITPEGTLYRKV